MKLGILALQGAVTPHLEKLKALGVEPVLVRRAEHLDGLSGIILPGGESTTHLHLLQLNQLWLPLREFCQTRAAWGICAGAILLAKRVSSPSQLCLELMDIEAERNSYGRQTESFVAGLRMSPHWSGSQEGPEAVFIRAPRINALSNKVLPLAYFQNDLVFARQENLLASTFHPELTDSLAIHEYFVLLCKTGWLNG